MDLGNRIKKRRKQLKMTAQQLADKLGVARLTVVRYEQDQINITTDRLSQICRALKTTPDYLLGFTNEETSQMSWLFNRLDEHERRQTIKYMQRQLDNAISAHTAKSKILSQQGQHEVKLYGYVSAGTGQTALDPEYSEAVVDGTVPKHDFAVRVIGDSMEPLFDDQQIVFVKRINSNIEIRNQQIVIVVLNGEAFIKKLIVNNGKIKLRSLNPTYPDLTVNEWDDFQIEGQVIL